MRPFEYVTANSVNEAASVLAEYHGRARPLAGGTDLLVQIRSRRREVDCVLDIKQLPELNEISFDRAKGLVLGAAVPCYRVYEDPVIAQHYAGLTDGASIIGGIQIQGRATVGGNLCNAAPSADCVGPLLALGATCVIASATAIRELPVEEFCTGPGQNALLEGELLVSLRLPPPPPHSGSRHLRFIPRNEMDIAVAGASAAVVLTDDGAAIQQARVAIISVAPTPLVVEEAGAVLSGRAISDEALDDAAEQAVASARPIDDMRGSVAQRRQLVRVLTKRALKGAIDRAREDSNGR